MCRTDANSSSANNRVKYSSHFDGLLGYANICIAKGNRHEAKKILYDVISAEERFVPAYESIIDILEMEGNHEEVLGMKLKMAEFSTKQSAYALQELAHLCVAQLKYDEALKVYKKMCLTSDVTLEMISEYDEFIHREFQNSDKLQMQSNYFINEFYLRKEQQMHPRFDQNIHILCNKVILNSPI